MSANAALRAVDDPVQLKLLQVRRVGQGLGGVRPSGLARRVSSVFRR